MCRILNFLIIPFMVLLMSCSRGVPEHEAKIMLRAFDNELITLAGRVQDSRSAAALKTILSAANAPLPFPGYTGGIHYSPEGSQFDNLKGVYRFDPVTLETRLTGKSDSIIIHFTDTTISNKPIRLIIAAYTGENFSGGHIVPVHLKASMYAGENAVMNIDHIARLEEEMPVSINTFLTFENYSLEIMMSTTLRRKHGRVKICFVLKKDDSLHARWDNRAKIGFTGQGTYVIKKLNMRYAMYPLVLRAKVRNDAIGRDATDYIEEFARNSKIKALALNGRKIGVITPVNRSGSDRFDLAIVFSNGSSVMADDLLLTAGKLLSVKKP
jgi:hypothetical protein